MSFTIFDFVGVTDYHGDDDEEIKGGFVVVKEPGGAKPEPRKLLVLDVHDHIDPGSRDWLTFDDAGNVVREDAVEARAGALNPSPSGCPAGSSDTLSSHGARAETGGAHHPQGTPPS